MSTNAIFKGDDTGAFGNNFITINLNNPNQYVIKKAQVYVNSCPFREPIINPDFPLVVNFTSQETERLRPTNVMNLVAYDSENRPKQCNGSLTFNCQNGVISNVRRSCC